MTTTGLLKEEDAARYLQVCGRTLRKERQAGRLAYVRIGRKVLYSPADLDSFIEGARECRSTAGPVHRTGNTTSPSTASDFEARLAKAESAKLSRLKMPIGKLRDVSERNEATGR